MNLLIKDSRKLYKPFINLFIQINNPQYYAIINNYINAVEHEVINCKLKNDKIYNDIIKQKHSHLYDNNCWKDLKGIFYKI